MAETYQGQMSVYFYKNHVADQMLHLYTLKVLIFAHSCTKSPKCAKISTNITRKRAVRENKCRFSKIFLGNSKHEI